MQRGCLCISLQTRSKVDRNAIYVNVTHVDKQNVCNVDMWKQFLSCEWIYQFTWIYFDEKLLNIIALQCMRRLMFLCTRSITVPLIGTRGAYLEYDSKIGTDFGGPFERVHIWKRMRDWIKRKRSSRSIRNPVTQLKIDRLYKWHWHSRWFLAISQSTLDCSVLRCKTLSAHFSIKILVASC